MQCTIRPWRLSDAADLARALNNKKVLDNLRDGVPYPYTEKDAIQYINTMLVADKNSVFAFTITLANKAIGSIGVFRGSNIHFRTAEIGYYLAEDYWNRGFMTDVLRQVCSYVFDNTDILRIFATPFAYNIGSCRALEKAGFSLEGVLSKNAVKNGTVHDMKLYAKLKE